MVSVAELFVFIGASVARATASGAAIIFDAKDRPYARGFVRLDAQVGESVGNGLK